jgi:glucuronate isomerase
LYDKARAGMPLCAEECEQFAAFVMLLCGHLDAEKGWVKQLHLGAMRNLNSRKFAELGRDTGFDSIGDQPQGEALAKYLDRLESEGKLPKMVLYNINPRDNYLLAAMAGSFQEAGAPGKIQFGSGWWFLDQKQGIEQQLDALSNNGLLSRFVGMLTDSRSFLSYPRHEYFRRVLCNLLGSEMEAGLLPNDFGLVGGMVEDICYRNAKSYFSFPGAGAA